MTSAPAGTVSLAMAGGTVRAPNAVRTAIATRRILRITGPPLLLTTKVPGSGPRRRPQTDLDPPPNRWGAGVTWRPRPAALWTIGLDASGEVSAVDLRRAASAAAPSWTTRR